MTVPAYDTSGKKVGQISLPKPVFGIKVNKNLMAQALRVYLTNQKTARPKVKSRGEVCGSGRKIWRQKGTGRARHGSLTAPIFVGGGVAHGPKGLPPKRLKMSKKMKRRALFSALSFQAKQKNIVVLKNEDKLAPKTKKAEQLFAKILGSELPQSLLISYNPAVNFKRATRNLAFLEFRGAEELNVYCLLKAKKVVLTDKALKQIKKVFVD